MESMAAGAENGGRGEVRVTRRVAAVESRRDNAGAETPDFVLQLLAELRASSYRPVGWLRFLGRSWRQARATAAAHPTLVTSWAATTTALTAGTTAALALEARLDDSATVRRALPGVALCLAAQQFDAYVHLGMNVPTRGEPLYGELGVPTALTLTRQSIAGLLWGHLLAGRPVARPYALAALLAAGATDIADGALARRLGHTTSLGQYLDSEADLSFWVALALTLTARGWLPRWLLALLLARWGGPFAFALARYFGWVSRVPIGSTITGKAAGVAQAVALGAAMMPGGAAARIARVRPLMHLATAVLLVAAPLSQLRKVLREG
ncbi:MAG: hypothetical protein PVSMB4_19140 [Ktedonobacterales bacterium]